MVSIGRFAAVILLGSVAVLSGCTGTPGPPRGTTGGGGGGVISSGGGNAPLSVLVIDQPATAVDVLSFSITITGATLQPGSVALISSPQTFEITQLQTNSALMTALNVPAGNYTSLDLTFANPSMTILNTGTALATTPICATNTFCTFGPALNAASVSLSTTAFPLTVSGGTPVGLLLDLNLSDLLQTDNISVDPTSSGAVTVSALAQVTSTQVMASISSLTGQVTNVGSNQFTLLSYNGDSSTISINGSTTYFYPPTVCQSNSFSCLAVDQIVTLQANLLGSGTIQAAQVNYENPVGTQEVEGPIVASQSNATSTTLAVVVNQVIPSVSGVSLGDIATVTIPNIVNTSTTPESNSTIFSIDSGGATLPAGVSFASPTELLVGQDVLVGISGSVSTTTAGPAFSANQITLRSGNVDGDVYIVDQGTLTFSMTDLPVLFTTLTPNNITQIIAQTSTTSLFEDLNLDSLAGLAAGQQVAVGGMLFNTVGSAGYPTIDALTVRGLTPTLQQQKRSKRGLSQRRYVASL
jgi:Domain of unknown function (DUF4382)/Domain of unknown function (DUF5666)